MLTCFGLAGLVILISSCSSLNQLPDSQLNDNHYHFRQPGDKGFKKVYVDIEEDSITIIHGEADATAIKPVKTDADEIFLKPSFDVDVMIAPFKFRPISNGLPRQLTTEFNGNVFVGYRVDRFRVHRTKTPTGVLKQTRHRAMTLGFFGGLGATSITPWTTSPPTTDEYSGFILSRGVALMFGINRLTVGTGVGWDYLTDRDKGIWIYQNRAWYGLTLSLNLN
jgi:hypothetical protein